ncbi:MAG TPA: hypothetical protein VMV81_02180 [Phycisphaerae bacterium]|nr:hypothetical protein [Phycisphaerae bacterium]
MKHYATPRFWQCYRGLPEEIQRTADKCYALLKKDSKHPSLHLKRAGVYWSARVGLYYRALAVESGADFIWFWIGPNAQYDKLLGRR